MSNIDTKFIIVNIDTLEETRFFQRFINVGTANGYKFVFLTYHYYIYLFAKKCFSSKSCVLFLKKSFREHKNDLQLSDKDGKRTIEYLNKSLSLEEVKKAYAATIATLLHFDVRKIDSLWCWNGYKAVDQAFKDFAFRYHLRTLYFEIANIDGKIFVDSKGTNCRSSLYLNKSVLDNIQLRPGFESWRAEYIRKKFLQSTVKQANRIGKVKSFKNYLLDDYGYFFHKGAVCRKISLSTLRRRLYKLHYEFSSQDFSQLEYVFFPLQVSTDTQVLINGNISLMDAIECACSYAQKHGIYLVIKPHPAEKNPIYFKTLQTKLNCYEKVVYTNENTFYLLKNAQKVFTINSTVGLEAMILKRPVHVFGKALYEQFTTYDLQKYIMGYLVNVDFWGTEDISSSLFDEILKRSYW